MASASAFQAEDDGSIPFTRSNKNTYSKHFKHQSCKLKPLNKVFCFSESFGLINKIIRVPSANQFE